MIASVLHAVRSRAKVSAVVHVMGIRVVALAGNVCSGLVTAAFLGPAGRGEQTAVGVVPLVLGSICGMGLHASLIYNLRRDPQDAPRYFGSALVLIAFASTVAMAVGFVLMPVWLVHYSSTIVRFARLLLVAVPLSLATPLLMAVLEADGQFGTANRALYFQSLGTPLILVGLVASGRLTSMSAASAYFVPSLPAFVYVLMQTRRVLRPRFTLAAPFPHRLLRYGLRFYGVDILSVLSGYLDQLVIVLLLQPAAVGAYAVALSFSRILGVAQGAVSTVLFPSVAAREPASVVEMVSRAMRVTAVVNIVGAMTIGLAAPSLLVLLYGTRFAAAIVPFLILLAEAIISSAARTLAQAFSGTGRPSAVTGVELAGVATSLLAMLLLVPAHGLVGAACGSLLGGCMRLLSVLGSFRKILGINIPRLVICRADVAWITGR